MSRSIAPATRAAQSWLSEVFSSRFMGARLRQDVCRWTNPARSFDDRAEPDRARARVGADHRPDVGDEGLGAGEHRRQQVEQDVDVVGVGVCDGQSLQGLLFHDLRDEVLERPGSGALAATSASTTPLRTTMTGLIDSSDPKKAWALPIRPPRRRYSSVSSRAVDESLLDVGCDRGRGAFEVSAGFDEVRRFQDEQALGGGRGERVDDGDGELAGERLGAGAGRLIGAGQSRRERDADDTGAAVVGRGGEGVVEGTGRWRRGFGEHVGLPGELPELLGGDPLQSGGVDVAEPHVEWHDGDLVLGEQRVGQVGRVVSDDANRSHGLPLRVPNDDARPGGKSASRGG